MSVIDFEAAKKWKKLPKYVQELLLNNVYCSTCGVTTIVDFTIENNSYGILLRGKCKSCGHKVARVIES